MIKTTPVKTLQHQIAPMQLACREAGGQVALAERIGYTQQVVSKWARGLTPVQPTAALLIEGATGISRKKLRPDLFGEF